MGCSFLLEISSYIYILPPIKKVTYYRLSRKLLVSTHPFNGSMSKLIRFSRGNGRLKQYNFNSEEDRDERWSKQLPVDIMQLVLQRLCIPDYLRCRAVCRSWRAAVNMEIGSKRCRPVPQLPWLMLGSHYFSTKDDCFFSPSDQKMYKPNPTYHMDRLDCVGSIDGWLVMVDTADKHPEGFMKPWSFYLRDPGTYTSIMFFLNPISGAKIMAPSLSTIPCDKRNYHFFFEKVVASSVPTSPHCLVAGVSALGHLIFCRPWDKSWTLIEKGEEVRDLEYNFHDIEIMDGKLYAITREASQVLIVYHIQLDVNGAGSHTYRAERLDMLNPRPIPFVNEVIRMDGVVYVDKGEITIYLFKDSTSKELFMIFVSKTFAYDEDPLIPWDILIGYDMNVLSPKTKRFRVFKLEHNNGSRWVEVVNLGDRILFLSHFSRSVIGHSYDSHGNTHEGNCIYFAFDKPSITSSINGYDFGVFSFASGRIKRHTFLQDHTPTRLAIKPIWFTPCLL